MRETLLHVTEVLTPERREVLCRVLERSGAGCNTRAQSSKPHLIFVQFDEARASPGSLIEALVDAGFAARLVDV